MLFQCLTKFCSNNCKELNVKNKQTFKSSHRGFHEEPRIAFLWNCFHSIHAKRLFRQTTWILSKKRLWKFGNAALAYQNLKKKKRAISKFSPTFLGFSFFHFGPSLFHPKLVLDFLTKYLIRTKGDFFFFLFFDGTKGGFVYTSWNKRWSTFDGTNGTNHFYILLADQQ